MPRRHWIIFKFYIGYANITGVRKQEKRREKVVSSWLIILIRKALYFDLNFDITNSVLPRLLTFELVELR